MKEKHENFIAAVRKWEMVAATKVKMGGSEEQVNRNKHNISSIKRVTGKYHVLVTQKKSALQEESFFFFLITPFLLLLFF